ncbi:MAG: SCO family protein [Pseudomonadota bacterium]
MRVKVIAASAIGVMSGMIIALMLIPGAIDYLQPRTNTWTTGKAAIGGQFEMTDHRGRTVTEKTFQGDYLLVFFGFTYCPDICPAALQNVSAMLERLGAKAEDITPLFVSVDPERDTPEVLKVYLSHFDSRIIGLTGTSEQVEEIVKTYRAYARKVKTGSGPDDYTMDHSAFIYFMDKKGEFITHFTPVTSFEQMAERIVKEML